MHILQIQLADLRYESALFSAPVHSTLVKKLFYETPIERTRFRVYNTIVRFVNHMLKMKYTEDENESFSNQLRQFFIKVSGS